MTRIAGVMHGFHLSGLSALPSVAGRVLLPIHTLRYVAGHDPVSSVLLFTPT